jgi:cobalamin biosynthesis protein CobT
MSKSLPIVAAALGRKFGVQVVMEGDQAKTNGSTIMLPVLADKDAGVEDVVWGYLAHESAHVRYTDFSVFSKSATSEIRARLLNIIEDVRIENVMSREYPGTRETLGKTVLSVLDEGGFNPDTATPAGILASHILLKLRNEVLGQEMLAPLADQADAALRKTFPKGMVTRLNGILTEIHDLGSTNDALRFADSILKMLKEEHDKAKKEEEEEDLRSGKKRKESKEEKSSKPKANQDSNSSGADGLEQDEDGTLQSDAHADTGDSDGETQDSPGGPDNGSSAIRKVIEATSGDLPEDVFQKAAELLQAKSAEGIRQHGNTRLPDAEIAYNTDALRNQILTRARANSSRLRAQLTGLVQSSREERYATKRTGRRLNNRRIHRVLLGDNRVFHSMTENTAPNTAVHLLVDVSGSMDNFVPETSIKLCDLALDSAVALSVALESIHGVNPAVTAFPGFSKAVQVLQRHGERMSHVAGRFHQIPRGGTPMYEALQYASCQTLIQPEPRKIFIVMTDGAPNEPLQVQKFVQEIESRSGADFYGIGIATMAVEDLFSKHFVIQDVSDLRAALFAIAREALLAA